LTEEDKTETGILKLNSVKGNGLLQNDAIEYGVLQLKPEKIGNLTEEEKTETGFLNYVKKIEELTPEDIEKVGSVTFVPKLPDAFDLSTLITGQIPVEIEPGNGPEFMQKIMAFGDATQVTTQLKLDDSIARSSWTVFKADAEREIVNGKVDFTSNAGEIESIKVGLEAPVIVPVVFSPSGTGSVTFSPPDGKTVEIPYYTGTTPDEGTTTPLPTINKSVGGYTGAGSKYEPRAVVHGNEYVIPSEMVNDPKYSGLISALEKGRLGYDTPQKQNVINITVNSNGISKRQAQRDAEMIYEELKKAGVNI
jgi:hypothetical protein